jgi:hypothetical protein
MAAGNLHQPILLHMPWVSGARVETRATSAPARDSAPENGESIAMRLGEPGAEPLRRRPNGVAGASRSFRQMTPLIELAEEGDEALPNETAERPVLCGVRG